MTLTLTYTTFPFPSTFYPLPSIPQAASQRKVKESKRRLRAAAEVNNEPGNSSSDDSDGGAGRTWGGKKGGGKAVEKGGGGGLASQGLDPLQLSLDCISEAQNKRRLASAEGSKSHVGAGPSAAPATTYEGYAARRAGVALASGGSFVLSAGGTGTRKLGGKSAKPASMRNKGALRDTHHSPFPSYPQLTPIPLQRMPLDLQIIAPELAPT